MAEQKKIHLDLPIPAQDAELFRVLVHNLRYRDQEDPTRLTEPLTVEILYEEEGRTALGNPHVTFSLWFEKPATAYWFALFLREAQEAWRKLPQEGGTPNG